ncbi:MAG: hypothetical protein ABIV21_04920 [Pyrinomonadaceae bacterium]
MKRTVVLLLILLVLSLSALAQQKTVVRHAKAAKMLLGKHRVSLQWISWDHFGTATVVNRSGDYRLKGEQRGRGSEDLLTVDGKITSIVAKRFVFVGKVVTQISHINGGKPCTREGEMTFKITGERKYWRMQEIDNPCDQAADYVDIYFR